MKINILRGQNQIGGSIIEISTETTRLIIDIGIELQEKKEIQVPSVPGLFEGTADVNAVLISHYHSDHVGLFPYLLPNIHVYMGARAKEVLKASYEYQNKEMKLEPTTYCDQKAFVVGDIKITPFRCDHSAFDSYMFLLENNGKKVLYTGDYRANGRSDFSALLEQIPTVDALITEGTTLSRQEVQHNIPEEKLEEIGTAYLQKHKGPAFFMMSAMNIDRLITAYHIAQRTNRIFLEDVYTAQIARASGLEELVPSKDKEISAFISRGGDANYKKLQEFKDAKIGKDQISQRSFVMCIRSSMKSYLEKLHALMPFEDGVLFYAMWKGYMEQKETREFLNYMESLGVKIHVLHTSGHADSYTIEQLVEDVKPQYIIPVHTENAEWFEKYAGESKVIKDQEVSI